MKLVSWNVNGLRAVHRKGALEWLAVFDEPRHRREETSPDVFCVQETKAEEHQLPPEVQNPNGYNAYFNSSRERKGYSGVATYSKVLPKKVRYDVLPAEFNTQGRVIETRFDNFVLLNGYFPNGGGSPEALKYKLDFYDAFLEHSEELRADGDSVVVCGDLNVSHEEIDVYDSKGKDDHILFLPEEREWFDAWVNLGYIDTFRHFHPNQSGAYTWWDMRTRARDRNLGWRIDYFIVSPDLIKKVKGAEILSQVYGSDHCPVLLELALRD